MHNKDAIVWKIILIIFPFLRIHHRHRLTLKRTFYEQQRSVVADAPVYIGISTNTMQSSCSVVVVLSSKLRRVVFSPLFPTFKKELTFFILDFPLGWVTIEYA